MSTKTVTAPKVTTKRAQRTLNHALARAQAAGDGKLEAHIKNLLNGATFMPVPNVKKVKK